MSNIVLVHPHFLISVGHFETVYSILGGKCDWIVVPKCQTTHHSIIEPISDHRSDHFLQVYVLMS